MKLLPWLLFLIAAALAWFFWQKSEISELRADQTKTELGQAVESRDSTERVTDARIQVLRDERRADSTKQAERTKSFHKRFNDQMSQIARLKEERTLAGIKIDTTTLKIETEYDSTIQAQAGEIDSLHLDIDKMKVSFQTEIDAVTEKLEAERKVSISGMAVIADLEKKNSKLKNLVKVLKATTVGAIAVAVVEFVIIIL